MHQVSHSTRQPVSRWNLPNLGLGLGLRGPHIGDILTAWPDVGWFEIITENFLVHRGYLNWVLERIAERYPVVMHGVSLSIGSTEPLDMEYLKAVKGLADVIEAPWVSDHVCWTGVGGSNSHDLLPVPYTEEMLRWMVQRIRRVQDVLERPLMLENPSSYVAFVDSPITEWDFIAAMAEEADCGLLLDVNNIYVSSVNHNFDPDDYLAAVPWDRVAQFHVAGHTDRGTHILDTHIGPVVEPVWALFGKAWRLSGGRSVLLEWDDEIPDFDTVWAEALKAERWMGDFTPAPRMPARAPLSRSGRPVRRREPGEPPPGTDALMRWMHAVVSDAGGTNPAEIGLHVLPNDRLSAPDRVGIYTRMVAIRFREAMVEDYPTVAALLGDNFSRLVAAYCREHPSTSWALEHLGRHFPQWLEDAPVPAYLADLAALEWAIVESHLSDRTTPLTREAFAAVSAEDRPYARIGFAPSMRLLTFQQPIQHLLEGSEEPETQGEEHVLIYRDGLQVQTRLMSGAEAAVMGELLSGRGLHDALVAVVSRQPELQDEVLQSLPGWTEGWAGSGLVVAVSLPTPAHNDNA